MNWPAQCAIIIPCLDEQAAIAALVSSVKDVLPTVIVVDDGSSDETASLAKTAGAIVLRHKAPAGKGAALQTGWRYAHAQGFRWALCMDGDGQHSPNDITAFLDCADRTRADFVIGNRMNDPRGMPCLRRFVNRWMSARISALLGRELPDTQCGFRLMNLDKWSELNVTAVNFEIESDTLVAFAKHGCSIEFVPIQVIYKSEQSKIHPLRDTLRWFRWWRKSRRFNDRSA